MQAVGAAPAATTPRTTYGFTVAGGGKDAAPAGGFPSMNDKTIKEKLTQWGLEQNLRGLVLRFTGRYRNTPEHVEGLLSQLFACPEVLECVQAGAGGAVAVHKVQWERLSCTTLSMDFFDCLTVAGIVSASGNIRGMMEELVDGLAVADRLRDALVNPASEHADALSKDKRSELIYHIFKALVVGGAMCQPEDNLQPYLDATKALYKDAVCVFKARDSPAIQVASHAFLVRSVAWDTAGPRLFDTSSPYNVCLVVVSPVRGQVALLHKTFRPFW